MTPTPGATTTTITTEKTMSADTITEKTISADTITVMKAAAVITVSRSTTGAAE